MDPLIGTFCGSQLPDTITSTSSVGSLTFLFHSDFHHTFSGWAATLKCIGGPLNMIANSFPANVCEGGSSQLVAIVNGGSGNYTYQWSPATYLDDPTSATPIATPESNITYTVTVSDGVNNLVSEPIALSMIPRPQGPVITLNGAQLESSSPTGNQWYIYGNLIPNANGQTYIPTASGDYTATVTSQPGGCESMQSNYITWLVTGISNPEEGMTFQIYPNPAREQIRVSIFPTNVKNVDFSISDASGRVLLRQAHVLKTGMSDNSFSMNVAQLSPGIYYCTLQSEKTRTVKKVIITK
jgi:hypothetical protein